MEEEKQLAGETPVKRKRQRLGLVILIALALMFLGSFLGGIIIVPIHLAFPENGPVLFLTQYLSFLGIDIAVLLYCALAEKEVFRSFLHAGRGGGRGNSLRLFWLGILLGFALNALCILAAWLHGDLDFSVGRFQAGYLLAAFLCVLVQSGAEELLTRGYILGSLRQRYPLWVAIAANSLLFGALHLFNAGITVMSMLNIVLIGLAMSLAVCYLDSIWLCVAFHTMWNFTQNFLFGLPNSGIVSQSSFLHLEAASDSVFYDAVFGVEGTITAFVLILLLTVGLRFFFGKREKPET